MQSIEKALHQPMPFTTGGQTITDRLTAARHALAGSQLGKTICKATTEELVAPKKKHLDYLLHCTNEPNVSIPSMANLLIERTQNPNWVVVYKALITIHNVMCYGNERFSQYLASCNTTFNLTNFLDKSNPQGYDMSNHVRRYGKYISEKIYTYRLCAFDFCKIKRGREDGVLRVMHTDKLLKTLPILQNQMDALLEFQVTSGELNNGVINCSFILLFRDLIRLFACYNDGVINLLEKFFDMNKKQAREAFDLYKSFLLRLDKVAAFLSVAESVGVDRGEIPDLTRAPASLVDALEAHLHQLEGGKGPLPSSVSASQQMVNQQLQQSQQQPTPLTSMSAHVDDSVRQRYIEEEKERLRQYEEQRQKQLAQQPQQSNIFNPFAPSQPTAPSGSALPVYSAPSNDPPLMFTQPQQNMSNAIPHSDLLELYKQPQSMVDPTNPFANFTQPQPAAYGGYPGGYGNPQPPAYSPYGMPQQQQQPFSYSQMPRQQSSRYNSGVLNGPPLNSSTTNGFKDYPQQPPPMIPPQPQYAQPQQSFNPFAMNPTPAPPQMQQPPVPQQQQQVQQMTNNPFAAPVSNFASQSQPPQPPNQPIPIPSTGQTLGIYDQTPFSGNDSSYTSPSHFQQQMEQASVPTSGGMTTSPGPPRPPPPVSATPPTVTPMPAAAGSFDPFATATISNIPPKQADINSTLSNLVDNMEIAGKNPAWMTPPGTTAPTYGQPSQQSSQSNPFNPFG